MTSADVPHQGCCCDLDHLTLRDLDVLELVARGLSNDQIAARLHVSTQTVAHHLSGMLRRLDAHNRAELVARGFTTGLLCAGQWPPIRSGRRCVVPSATHNA